MSFGMCDYVDDVPPFRVQDRKVPEYRCQTLDSMAKDSRVPNSIQKEAWAHPG